MSAIYNQKFVTNPGAPGFLNLKLTIKPQLAGGIASMNFIQRNLRNLAVAMTALVIGVASTTAFGQEDKAAKAAEKAAHSAEKAAHAAEKAGHAAEKMAAKAGKMERGFCSSNNWSSSDKVSFSELREMTVSAGGVISVDGDKNGGIAVKGEDRSDVLIRACVQTWGRTDEEARAQASAIRIGTAGAIKADGPDSRDMGWSVSYQLLVPRSSNLKLKAHNGGISIANIDGAAEFETLNGGVSLNNVGGDFRGKTMNGGVNVSLTGASWRGSGLDVTTQNGGVHISMPENYAARIETGTVNGGFSSDIPALAAVAAANKDANGYRRPGAKISQDLNGGGATLRVMTTNGGVRIGTADHKE